jgi:hypothetical protein
MTLEHWAYAAQIIGVIAVIASLAYVAMQVRQNTVTQIAASRQAILAADLELLSWALDYPEDATGLGDSIEDVRTTAFLVAYVRIREFMWYQYEHGILDRRTWESYLAPTSAVFQSDLARRLWAGNVMKVDARFREQLDGFISDPVNSSSADHP